MIRPVSTAFYYDFYNVIEFHTKVLTVVEFLYKWKKSPCIAMSLLSGHQPVLSLGCHCVLSLHCHPALLLCVVVVLLHFDVIILSCCPIIVMPSSCHPSLVECRVDVVAAKMACNNLSTKSHNTENMPKLDFVSLSVTRTWRPSGGL